MLQLMTPTITVFMSCLATDVDVYARTSSSAIIQPRYQSVLVTVSQEAINTCRHQVVESASVTPSMTLEGVERRTSASSSSSFRSRCCTAQSGRDMRTSYVIARPHASRRRRRRRRRRSDSYRRRTNSPGKQLRICRTSPLTWSIECASGVFRQTSSDIQYPERQK